MSIKTFLITAVVSARFLPQTYFLDRYKKFRAAYGFDGKELPVSKEVQQRFMQVLDDLKIIERKRDKIKLFSVHDVKIFHAGSSISKYGAVIGIPPSFNYKNADDLSVEQIQIRNKRILWTEETSRQFLDSLVLSDNAQKFALAKEILYLQRYEFLISPLIEGLDVFIAFSLHDMFHSLLKLETKSKLYNYFFLAFTFILCFVIWQVSEEKVQSNLDNQITEKIIALGPEYIQGGKEYYEKLCQRDDVLKYVLKQKLLSKSSSWFFKSEIPPSEQKEFFTLKLQEMGAV